MFSLPALEKAGFTGVSRLPFSLKILLENLLRREDARFVDPEDIQALAALGRDLEGAEGDRLHAGPRAAAGLHRRSRRSSISPRCATASCASAATRAKSIHCSRSSSSSIIRCRSTTTRSRTPPISTPVSSSRRNRERYTFLRWGQDAFQNFRVVPPDTGIVHQVNLEYLARVIFQEQVDGR